MHVVTVHFEVNPRHQVDFLREIRHNAACTLALEPGCRQFDVCTSPNREGMVFLYEVYDDRLAFDAHLASAHYKTFDALTREWVELKQVSEFERQT